MPGQIWGDFQVCEGEGTLLTGWGANTYLWNGAGGASPSFTLSNLLQDTTIFMIPLTAGCPGDTVFATVNTLDRPVADFSVNTVCAGLPTAFQDLSSVSTGTVVLRQWDFGDPLSAANTSTLAAPTHVFSQAGLFNVQLVVTSENGCVDTLIRSVEVKPVPEVDFTFSNVCEGLANVFADATTLAAGSTVTAYTWDFGDGSAPALGTQVSHVYGSYGY